MMKLVLLTIFGLFSSLAYAGSNFESLTLCHLVLDHLSSSKIEKTTLLTTAPDGAVDFKTEYFDLRNKALKSFHEKYALKVKEFDFSGFEKLRGELKASNSELRPIEKELADLSFQLELYSGDQSKAQYVDSLKEKEKKELVLRESIEKKRLLLTTEIAEILSTRWPSSFEVTLAQTPPLQNELAVSYITRLSDHADISVVSYYVEDDRDMMNIISAELEKNHSRLFQSVANAFGFKIP